MLPKNVYKAHGTGNDFVIYVDLSNSFIPKASEIQKICDRHFGLGGDGLIRIGKKDHIDGNTYYFMDYYNSDGGVAQMCGNGVRVTALILDYLDLHDFKEPLRLLTRAGVKFVTRKSNGASNEASNHAQTSSYSVDMGAYSYGEHSDISVQIGSADGIAEVFGRFVDMGNEHIVSILPNREFVDSLDLQEAPQFQTSSTSGGLPTNLKNRLKNGANFEFIAVDSSARKIYMRVYERGVGETLSCGTGICASAIAVTLETAGVIPDSETPNSRANWEVIVPGGMLDITLTKNSITLEGSAELVGRFERF